jgi:hypothetical protein
LCPSSNGWIVTRRPRLTPQRGPMWRDCAYSLSLKPPALQPRRRQSDVGPP